MLKRLLIAFALVIVITAAIFTAKLNSAADPMAAIPKVVLWAWERSEDLSFINTREVAVAFFARTLYLKQDAVSVRPRLQPLELPPGAALIAVVRIETDSPALSDGQLGRTVAAIAEVARDPSVIAVQIDFDARLSERDFYSKLLINLRREMPASKRLSITALASWCIHDDWLEGLPVDEAVPMLFRMGPDRGDMIRFLKAGHEFRATASRNSLGISTDEPLTYLPSGRRVYVFNPRPWTEQSVTQTLDEVKRLR